LGYLHEFGFCKVEIDPREPLFGGFGSEAGVHQEHYWEVKAVPDGFRSIASSEACAVQGIAHESLPLFGTQFHPEFYDNEHTDGRRIIQNFLRMMNIS
jgi:GMP synthase-like glutamine amidotransferase